MKGQSMLFWTVLLVHLSFSAVAQTSARSLMINHGSNCGSNTPEQDFITGALSASPNLVASGNVGVPYYSVMAAYNPEDHKVYYAQVDGANTYIYAVDYNLNGTMTSPTLPAPTYTYNYPLNQLCFDNYGDNYVFSNFNVATGTVTLNRVDIATGVEIPGSNKQLTFPAGQIPNTMGDGDVVVLPNGRMFMNFGNAPSKLYEVDNTDGPGKGTITFLADLPRVCFSNAYVDGNLVLAGSDGGGCYYFIWDINSSTLSPAYAFPVGKSSADLSSMTTGVGVANRLLGANITGASSATIFYEVVLKNKGNTNLNNLQLTNNLAQTFAGASITNVQVTVVSNPANLALNPTYNGISDINLLAVNQTLNNFPLQQDSLVLRIQFTASNLTTGLVYRNSALASAQTGAGSSLLLVTDSSNNGNWSRIDIDRNGVSDDVGENIPTPFVFGSVLATAQLELKGAKTGADIQLSWQSTLGADAAAYEVQRSFDGKAFEPIAIVNTAGKTSYALHDDVSTLHQRQFYYRVKAVKANQSTVYSNTITMSNSAAPGMAVSVFPNPVQAASIVRVYTFAKTKAEITLLNVSGRTLWRSSHALEAGNNSLTVAGMDKIQPGSYWLSVNTGNEKKVVQVLKQ